MSNVSQKNPLERILLAQILEETTTPPLRQCSEMSFKISNLYFPLQNTHPNRNKIAS